MHAARPTSNTVPCATCGERVDALRAPRVRATETTLLLFCGDQCAKLYRPTNSVSPATAVRDPSGVHRTAEPAPELAQSPRIAAITAPPADVPWVALSLAGAGLVSAVLAHWFPALAIPSAVLSASAAVGAGWLHSAEARYIGWLPTLIGPAGAMVAAASAMVPETAGGAPVARLVGAALAGFAVVHRAWVDTRASQPVRALLEELESSVPRSGQMIAAGDTFDGVVPRKIIGVDAARRGESIVVHAEGQIAVDGVVQSGSAVVQRHPFDPTPVIRTEGQTIVAGARVLEGELRMLITATGPDRALLRPLQFGSATALDTSLTARAGHAFRAWGGPAVAAAAVLGFLLASHTGLGSELGVVAAVLLSAPLLAVRRTATEPLLAAAASAARRGVFFHDTAALARAGAVGSVVVQARGTLTTGLLEVASTRTVADDDEATVIGWAAGAELAMPNHAVARAVLTHAERSGVRPTVLRRPTFVPGRGILATSAAGEPVVVGTRQLLLENGVSVAVADGEAKIAESRGHTVVFVGVAGRVRGILALRDTVRPGARAAMQRLIDMDADVVLMSGDARGSVEILAKHLALDHVRAELPPADRSAEVTRLGETGRIVAVFGRPGLDDDALSAADVPVMIDAAGGLESHRGGSVAIASDDVRDAASALWLARATRRATRSASIASVLGGTGLTILAAGGLLPVLVAAVAAAVLDAYALATGARLLRRFAMRVPESK